LKDGAFAMAALLALGPSAAGAAEQAASTDRFRIAVGGRADVFQFDVDASRAAHADGTTDTIASPTVGLALRPWDHTELFATGGCSCFAGRDVRNVAGRIDPETGGPLDGADPLVRSSGAELGIRTAPRPDFRSSARLWLLDTGSELLFAGDPGTNDPSRPGRRYGVEIASAYEPTPWLALDADVALSRSRLRGDDALASSVDAVIAVGVSIHDLRGFFGRLGLRHFRSHPTARDVPSGDSTVVDLEAGYAFDEHLSFAVEVANVFDGHVSDADAFYASRLPGGPDVGVEDAHTRPAEARAIRATITYAFGGE
jgi:outer membrane receptor protein involved in Fe transport